MKNSAVLASTFMAAALLAGSAQAAVSINRTRVIFPGDEKVVVRGVYNFDTKNPYLVQAWVSDAQDNKLDGGPLMVLPPVMRIEANGKNQMRIQAMPGANLLRQDRETLFYLHILEIPPKSELANTLQLAQETRMKLFYRPTGLKEGVMNGENPQINKVTITKNAETGLAQINNPTPYYLSVSDIQKEKGGKPVEGFKPVLVPPMDATSLSLTPEQLGMHPVINYINDYGMIGESSYFKNIVTKK